MRPAEALSAWRQGFAVAEQQLELPRGWLASGAPAPSPALENGYANGANGASAPAQPALRITEEGDSIVVTGPRLRAQARDSFWGRYALLSVQAALGAAEEATAGDGASPWGCGRWQVLLSCCLAQAGQLGATVVLERLWLLSCSVRAQIGKASGCLEAWEVGGRALLAEPMRPSFFRAPTDNDLGGSNNISFAVRRALHSSAPCCVMRVLGWEPVGRCTCLYNYSE